MLKNESLKLTTAQFAKLHKINKRTYITMMKLIYLNQNLKVKIIIDITIIFKVLN